MDRGGSKNLKILRTSKIESPQGGSGDSGRASKKKRLSAHTHDIYERGIHNPHTKEVGVLILHTERGVLSVAMS